METFTAKLKDDSIKKNVENSMEKILTLDEISNGIFLDLELRKLFVMNFCSDNSL